MSVIFTSTIKVDEDQKWFIELKDMVDSEVVICKSIDEYTKMVEELGKKYGGHVDSVNWYKDQDVPPYVMDDIRFKMAELKQEVEKETGKSIDSMK
ncbi:hypothetical protein [Sulfurimonas sp. HSL-1716]|uniref:hypothetical protein n=1 Tax=Hydrocurvibacter sulfurireducens TaxID=3131937 RepID=UPI0031F91FF7